MNVVASVKMLNWLSQPTFVWRRRKITAIREILFQKRIRDFLPKKKTSFF
jgi:hypothetical protein